MYNDDEQSNYLGEKENHILMTDECGYVLSIILSASKSKEMHGVMWFPSHNIHNMALLQDLYHICSQSDSSQLMKLQMFWRETNRKLSTDCFIWVGSNRWVKFRRLHSLPTVLLFSLSRLIKHSFPEFSANAEPHPQDLPSQEQTKRGQRSRLDEDENVLKIDIKWWGPDTSSLLAELWAVHFFFNCS